MSNTMRKTIIAVCLFTYLAVATAMAAQAQIPGLSKITGAKTPSPELINDLTKKLSITPEQAIGGSGALFGLAKTRLKPEEFSKVADAVPGMDGLLKAAPKQEDNSADALGSLASMIPGKAGGIASVASSFKSLGLSPSMAMKFIPIMTKFVDLKGGTSVGKLLGGALK